MEIRKAYCLFEQSGTFKNEFIRLGIPAEDYDIQDKFGQTDHRTDLFAEIERAWGGMPSIIDGIGGEDLIMAFFPCVYFSRMQMGYYEMTHFNLSGKPKRERYETVIDRIRERERFYLLLYKLVAIADTRALRLIVENPYGHSYLFFPQNFIAPTLIDRDRTRRGDEFRKPTAYWFINCEPTYGESYTHPKTVRSISYISGHSGSGICDEERSMISSEYARNFICDFILGRKQDNTLPTLFDEYE